jgi:predicted NAD/FAD-binding protein
MKLAVIGSGISGLSSAWLLREKHQVTLYEAADYLGGHTHTVDVVLDGVTHGVDTGFLVYNTLTYPNLINLFKHLGVETHTTDMSFSVKLPDSALEWAGSSLATVFGQKRNLLRPRFWLMLKEILSFNAQAEALLVRSEQQGLTLGALLEQQGYSKWFSDWYLLPMAAAIWSASPKDILSFPAATFLRFCLNHRLLQVNDRPEWRSVLGGARNYVSRMAEVLDVRLKTPVERVQRREDWVELTTSDEVNRYDGVIFATHAPDTLGMLVDADNAEQQLLGAVGYRPNLAVLHTDRSFLPEREALWSAWNYLSQENAGQAVCVTYLLNRLQALPFKTPVMVTLNPPPSKVIEGEIARFSYDHPVFNQAAIDAQHQLPQLQGRNRTWYCGAWCGYGFHEDGLKSALRIIKDFDVEAPWPIVL